MKLSSELVDILLKGTDVFCEICGFPFVGIRQGEVKPLAQDHKEEEPSQGLSKRESQWIKWKNEWNKWKGGISKQFNQSQPQPHQVNKRSNPESQTYAHPTQPQSNNNFGTTSPNEYYAQKTLPAQISPSQSAHEDDTTRYLNKALKIMIGLTPIYYIIIFLAALGATVGIATEGSPMAFMTFGHLFVIVVLSIIDHAYYLPHERNGRPPHAGIGQIFFGFFTLSAMGAGGLMFARGIVHLVQFINTTQKMNPAHPAIQKTPQRFHIWIREILWAIIPQLFVMVLALFLSSIFFSIGVGLSEPDTDGFLPATIALSSISFLVFLIAFPGVKRELPQKIRPNSWLLFIIFGLMASGNGFGTILLVFGILLILYKESLTFHPDSLPLWIDIGQTTQPLHVKVVSVPEQQIPTHHTPPVPIGIRTAKRFDPETGEPIYIAEETEGRQKQDPSPPPPFTLSSTSNQVQKAPSDQNNLPGAIMDQVFTVLEPEVRARLITLEIEPKEKDEIAKAFIYLTTDQQLRYLEEIAAVNGSIHSSQQNYIRRIQSLQIPAAQQKFLMEQLDYLPLEKQDEFVRFIEQTATNQK
jgi:hypothetical protein